MIEAEPEPRKFGRWFVVADDREADLLLIRQEDYGEGAWVTRQAWNRLWELEEAE